MADHDINEIWRLITAHPDYEVSNMGRIRRITPGSNSTYVGKIRKLNPTWMGYLQITLRLPGEPKRFRTHYVHRLVANAFVPKRKGKPDINHINGIKTDNPASNLEWCFSKRKPYPRFQDWLTGCALRPQRHRYLELSSRRGHRTLYSAS